jgi:hypothetical protein
MTTEERAKQYSKHIAESLCANPGMIDETSFVHVLTEALTQAVQDETERLLAIADEFQQRIQVRPAYKDWSSDAVNALFIEFKQAIRQAIPPPDQEAR